MYNPSLTSKIDIKIFDTRLTNDHRECYPTNMAQFLSEDGGYIICLIKNMTFIVSKYGEYLTEYTLDYMRNLSAYPIIPYGHSGTQYYYLIITIEGKQLIFRKYIYDSYSKIISHSNTYSYDTTKTDLKSGIACQLMNYTSQKVISCIFGKWDKVYCKIFNIIDCTEIVNLGGSISTGGQYFKSSIMTPERTIVAFSSLKEHTLFAYIYDILHIYDEK